MEILHRICLHTSRQLTRDKGGLLKVPWDHSSEVFCQSIKYLIKQNYSYFVDIFYFKDVCIGIHKMGQFVSYGVN